MPVTKVVPAVWSGHTAIAVREFTSRRLLVVTRDATDTYFWVSTDCGNTWAAHSVLASRIGAPLGAVSLVQADNKVYVVWSFSVANQFNWTRTLLVFGEDDNGETYVDGSGQVSQNSNGYPYWLIRKVGTAEAARYATSTRIVTAGSLVSSGSSFTSATDDIFVDWSHTGDGRTAGTSQFYFGTSGSILISNAGILVITDGTDRVAACDGSNVWLTEDDDGDSSRLIRVPYSRLSQTGVDLGTAGDWQAFAHYQGRLFAVHSGDSGKVHVLDTATSTFTSAEKQSHVDFASDTFDAERYPVENAMFLVRTSSGEAAFYRVTLNTSPARPVLTVPMRLPVADDLTLAWTFVDSDGDSQSGIALRRRTETNTAWEYWDGNSWETTETRLTRTTQTIALGEADWLDDADDDHWFGIKVYDSSGGDGNASEWSADARVTPVPAPTVALVSLDGDAIVSGAQTDVVHTNGDLVWTATAQDAYRIHLYEYDSSETDNRGDPLFDTGDLSSAAREHELEFVTDGERGILVLDVSYLGSEADEQSTEYLVDLPEPPGDSTTTIAVNGTYSDHLRVSASWSPPTGVSVSTADLHRRVVSEGGDGVRLAAALTAASDAVTFDDWLVASGVAYEYRWRALSADGVATLDSTWTA